MSDELALLDATAQAELVRQRKASPRELVDAAIARIERVNPKLNAVIIQRFEKARAEAAAPDLPDGPFRGVPFLPFNVTGQPAISLPLYWSTDGLPIGVQLGAAYGREDLLIRIAAQLEGARPWSSRRPPVHA